MGLNYEAYASETIPVTITICLICAVLIQYSIQISHESCTFLVSCTGSKLHFVHSP